MKENRPAGKKMLNTFLGVFITILCIPLFQYYTQTVTETKLKGAVETHALPQFSMELWWDETFQKSYDKFFNSAFGFRPDMVRLNNQIEFSFFNKLHTQGIVFGKEGFLFEKAYIDAALGNDFIGDSLIQARVNRLAAFSQEMEKRWKHLIILLAPGKAAYYPEYIPDRFKSSGNPTNYEKYKKLMAEKNLLVLDMHQWFRNMKDTCRFPLFPQTGVHWSEFGMTMVVDTLIRYMEIVSGKDMPNLKIEGVEVTDVPRSSDRDIEDAMNLMIPLKRLPFAYQKYTWENPEGKYKPKAIIISDSFFWQMFNMGITVQAFGESWFWYYFQQEYPGEYVMLNTVNQNKKLNSTEFIIIICTDANLDEFPWQFDEKALSILTYSEEYKKERIDFYVGMIKFDKNWLEAVRKQSLELNIPLDSGILNNARYMVEMEASGQI
jgi:hypothetical protein